MPVGRIIVLSGFGSYIAMAVIEVVCSPYDMTVFIKIFIVWHML